MRNTWKKGQSGNPKGRPKVEQSISAQIRFLLRTKCSGKAAGGKRSYTRARNIAEKIVALGETGDLGACHIILDRLEGKVKVPVGIEGGQDPIKLELSEGIQEKLDEIYPKRQKEGKSDKKNPQ